MSQFFLLYTSQNHGRSFLHTLFPALSIKVKDVCSHCSSTSIKWKCIRTPFCGQRCLKCLAFLSNLSLCSLFLSEETSNGWKRMEFLFLWPFDPTTVVSSCFLLLKLVTAHRIFMEISWTFLASRLTTPASLVAALLLCTSDLIYSLWSLQCASGLFDVRFFLEWPAVAVAMISCTSMSLSWWCHRY